MPLFRF